MLALAGTAALCFALAAAVVLRPNTRFFIYNIPIGFVFVLAALDWLSQFDRLTRAQMAVIVVTVGIALARMGGPAALPYSGHAVFALFALGTTRRGWVRLLAAAVLAQVTVLKLVFWQDTTWFGGMLIGVVALVVYHIAAKQRS